MNQNLQPELDNFHADTETEITTTLFSCRHNQVQSDIIQWLPVSEVQLHCNIFGTDQLVPVKTVKDMGG